MNSFNTSKAIFDSDSLNDIIKINKQHTSIGDLRKETCLRAKKLDQADKSFKKSHYRQIRPNLIRASLNYDHAKTKELEMLRFAYDELHSFCTRFLQKSDSKNSGQPFFDCNVLNKMDDKINSLLQESNHIKEMVTSLKTIDINGTVGEIITTNEMNENFNQKPKSQPDNNIDSKEDSQDLQVKLYADIFRHLKSTGVDCLKCNSEEAVKLLEITVNQSWKMWLNKDDNNMNTFFEVITDGLPIRMANPKIPNFWFDNFFVTVRCAFQPCRTPQSNRFGRG